MFLLLLLLTSLTSSSSSALLLVVAAAGAFLLYRRYQNNRRAGWSHYGITCPKVSGNIMFQINLRNFLEDWLNKYGETFGLESGSQLVLVTANLDLWRNILIKDFSNFVDREPKIHSASPFFKSVFFAPGSEWRKHRNILSPTFTTGKLKYISLSVQKSAQDLAEYLERSAKTGSPVLIKDVCGTYTSEIIAKTAFGLDAKFIGQKDVEFYNYSKDMISFKNRRGLSKIISEFLERIPYLRQLSIELFNLQYYDPINLEANKYFHVILKSTIEERRQQQKHGLERPQADLLDLLLRANEEAELGTLEAAEELKTVQEINENPQAITKLRDEEMLGHSMLVIFAGMETTATTLQMCLYELAANPGVQDKVAEEIITVVKHEPPTSEELISLTYTQQVLDETLRLYPPVGMVKRIALETKTYNGVTIPKGTHVILPYFYTLRDPKIYPDPGRFDPNRFSSSEKEKRDPLAFPAFGHGPRICLGMRLAYLELKQGLVHILRKLRVVLNDETEPREGSGGVKFKEHNLLVPEKPVALAFELREPNETAND